MIHIESHSVDWLEEVKKKFPKRDPGLIEKVIRALTLLEQLQLVGLDFVFKGGTCLILLLKTPQRFSIDIDILLPKIPEDLEKRFDGIIANGYFLKFEEDKRKYSGKVPKKHYKFYYQSALSGATKNPPYILLDILEQESTYPAHSKAKVESIFLKTDGEPTEVTIPTVDSILGDKLTAFAPKTTGIRYNDDKDLEIIKQLFDVSHLFDEFSDVNAFLESFRKNAIKELDYREIAGKTHEHVLLDSLEAAETLVFQGQVRNDEYRSLQNGVLSFSGYLFTKKFNMDVALTCAGKVAYLASGILKDNKTFKKFNSPNDVVDLTIQYEEYNKLNKLKRSNPEAFFYWYQASLFK